MADQELTTYLKDHPRMIGGLFMLMLLLGQAGNASAGVLSTNPGP